MPSFPQKMPVWKQGNAESGALSGDDERLRLLLAAWAGPAREREGRRQGPRSAKSALAGRSRMKMVRSGAAELGFEAIAVETGSRYLSGWIANNINSSSSLGPAGRL